MFLFAVFNLPCTRGRINAMHYTIIATKSISGWSAAVNITFEKHTLIDNLGQAKKMLFAFAMLSRSTVPAATSKGNRKHESKKQLSIVGFPRG